MFILKNNAVGISLKKPYYTDILNNVDQIDFVEAHIENYISGGFHLNYLKNIAHKLPVSLHGVALSLGGKTFPSDKMLLERAKIIDLINPIFFSEHAACTSHTQHYNDLLPISLNIETVKRIVNHIDYVQNFFKRQILLENLSSYIVFDDDTLSEADFLNMIAERSGCGLLLDINNIYVQEFNLKRSASIFLETINPIFVQQYHLAGGEYNADHNMIIDTHGTDIPDEVLDLYEIALKKIGLRPTLYERDNNLPTFNDLCMTVTKIRNIHAELLG